MSFEFAKNYEVLENCGEGGLAIVLKVRNQKTGEICAFKKLKESTPDNLRALKREYDFLRNYQHPTLPRVDSFFDLPDGPGFIMDYVEGVPLSSQNGNLLESELEAIFLQMLEIAQFINHCGYLYGDYKPANFLLRYDGKIKLIDFNLISREIDKDGSLSGTIQYLAPELLTGGEKSPLTDIYSLGVCFYEIATGSLPFNSESVDTILKAIAESMPPMPALKNEKMAKAILAMIARDPAERPASPFAAASLFGWKEKLAVLIKANAEAYINIPQASDHAELSAESSVTWAIDRYLKRHQLPPELIATLNNLGKGNDKILRSYIEFMIDSGQIAYGDSGWFYQGGFDYSIIPDAAIIEHKKGLRSLNENAKTVLDWLAIAKSSLAIEHLLALSGISNQKLNQVTASLMAAGVVEKCADGYSIVNLSLSEFLYSEIDRARCRLMHLQLADRLAATKTATAGQIALHYYEAQSYDKAFEYSELAATEFFEKFDFANAQKHSARSIHIIESGYASNLKLESRIAAYILAGDIAKALADNTNAEKYYIAAAAFAEKDFPDRLALVNKNLADLYRIIQKTEKSIEHSIKALSYYKDANDLSMQAACLNNIGLACWNLGDYSGAERYFNEALEINRKLDNLVEQSKLHSNIGIICDITGRKEEVLEHFERALECSRKAGDLKRQTAALNNIGFFLLNSGNPHKALNYFLESRKIAKGIGLTQMELDIISNIGWAYHELGDFMKSVNYHQESLKLAEQLGNGMIAAKAGLLIAADCLALGNYKLALTALQEAERLSQGLSNNELAADLLLSKIEFVSETEPDAKPDQLLSNICAFASLTSKQNLWKRYWLLRFENDTDIETVARDGQALMESAKLEKYPDLLVRTAAYVAGRYLAGGDCDMACGILEKTDTNGAGILATIDFKLVLATAKLTKNLYDDALELAELARQLAGKSGCLPLLFRANLVETEIYDRCGKQFARDKSLAAATSIFEMISAAYATLSGNNLPVRFTGVAYYYNLLEKSMSSPAGEKAAQKENRPNRAVFVA